MIFESTEQALHYASESQMDVVFYEDRVVEVTEFIDHHPGNNIIINLIHK